MHDGSDIDGEMRRLARGFLSGSWKDGYRAYRALYRAGPAAIPALERQLAQSDWKELQTPGAIRLLTAMVALLRDIDESRSDEVIDRILHEGCHPAVCSSLKVIQRYRNADFRRYDIGGLTVFEAKDLDPDQQIGGHLKQWLEIVPPADLSEIERLYVVRRRETMDYGGQYMPILATIVVVWLPAYASRLPMSALARLSKRFTLYHEIGHHVHRHDFGQQPEQEREANRYAARLMAKAHPVLAVLARVLRWIVPSASRHCRPRHS